MMSDMKMLTMRDLNRKRATVLDALERGESFGNSRQRPLAAAAGLRVWPPLDKEEKGLVRHATRDTVE